MAEEKATKEKLLESAKKEFLEKGYMKASLRTICKNAGVTTGALYFFFRNKQELLSAIVEELIESVLSLMREHFLMEMETNASASFADDASEDVKAARGMLHYLYQHYDICMILLTKSQGSIYENVEDRFVEVFEQHYHKLTEQIAKKQNIKKPNDYIIHWMAHMQTDAIMQLLIHVPEEKTAQMYIKPIISYLVIGWGELFQEKED